MEPLTRQDVLDVLTDEECLLADGFEAALVGYVQQFNRTTALYDYEACIKVLVDGGMDEEEAAEYFDFNVAGAYVGEKTPSFAFLVKEPPDA